MLAARLCRDPRLTANQLRVALTLLLHFHNTRSGACFPSYQQLANASCTSKTTAKRTTKKLKEMGVIDFPSNMGGRSRRNFYVFKTVSPAAPYLTRKDIRGGPFKKANGVVSGPETGSPADPHISNERSNEGSGAPSSAPSRRSQANETSTHQKLSHQEIKRRDQMVKNLKAELAKSADHMMVRKRV